MLNEQAKALKKARAARYYEKHRDQVRRKHSEYYAENKASHNARSTAYYIEHREDLIAKSAVLAVSNPRPRVSASLRHHYQINITDYEVLLMNQRWVCAICGGVNHNGRRLSVDHDHQTNEIRGLLCNPCNLAIGWMRDDPNRLRSAASYLERTMCEKPRINIKIERFKNDTESQGSVTPAHGRWQLVIDKEGYPHLFVESNIENKDGTKSKGLFCIEDLLPEGMSIKDIMNSTFGGELSPEEELEAQKEYESSREATGIPCPR